MARITYTNLFSEARNNIVSLLSNKSNVADPTTASSEFRKWIYAREPDVKSSDFKGYPFIIIHPVDFENDEGGSVDGKSKFVSWEIEIEIVASDRGYGGQDGKGLTHIDAVSDSIAQTLADMTNRKTLQTQAMYFARFTSSQVVTEDIGEELVYRRSFILEFRSRIQVSA
jgi:hypothetical protein